MFGRADPTTAPPSPPPLPPPPPSNEVLALAERLVLHAGACNTYGLGTLAALPPPALSPLHLLSAAAYQLAPAHSTALDMLGADGLAAGLAVQVRGVRLRGGSLLPRLGALVH